MFILRWYSICWYSFGVKAEGFLQSINLNRYRKVGATMNTLRFPVFFFTMLFVAGHVLQADLAISADCNAPCTMQYRACFDIVKDSPNDIERELCEIERKECFAKCAAVARELQKELHNKELRERALLGQPAKRSAQEREEGYEKAAEEKQEQQDKAARELKEQQDKAAQEKLENETLNGTIKIYQFDN
jgi:hypothetical protein